MLSSRFAQHASSTGQLRSARVEPHRTESAPACAAAAQRNWWVVLLSVAMLSMPAAMAVAADNPLSADGAHEAANAAADASEQPAPPLPPGDEEHLKLPEHPGRRAPQATATTPKPAKQNRSIHRTVPTRPVRTGTQMPIPGRPARRLPSLVELKQAEAEAAAAERAAAREEAAEQAREAEAAAEGGEDTTDSAAEDEDAEEEVEEEEEEADDEEEECEEPPGLLLRLTHGFACDAITGEYIYTGESFTLAKGGRSRRQTTNYRGNMDVVLTFDFEKLGLWKGARVFLYANNVHGRTLSPLDVGDYQLFSNIDSTIGEDAGGNIERPHYTAVGEYWYEQLLLDDLVRFKIGKQDSNADFAYTDFGGDFVHSTFSMPTMIPLPTWPSQALGFATFWTLLENITFAAGGSYGT